MIEVLFNMAVTYTNSIRFFRKEDKDYEMLNDKESK